MSQRHVTLLLVGSLFVGGLLSTTTAHAKAYWTKPRWVTLRRRVTIKKVQPTTHKVLAKITLKKGSNVQLTRASRHAPWVLRSGKYAPTAKVQYTITRANKPRWFDLGITVPFAVAPKHIQSSVGKTVYLSSTVDDLSPADFASTQTNLLKEHYSFHPYPFGATMTLTRYTHHKGGWGVGQVRYHGKTYFAIAADDEADVVPYNTYTIDGNMVVSSANPNNAKSVVLRPDSRVTTKSYWSQSQFGGKDDLNYRYNVKTKHWDLQPQDDED
ncbi:hypothetical protein [Levilactobacillus zymae]|uniref:hypothetical protein n=1 Tax=Levilactobacillus zymae TaxID=267363 RepID=UPI0028BC9F80|nr:hypothetical protein [Levilactobacillus zymae]MDT6979700.1 hypothetical protein [Levilactobacillus zymae]